MSDAPQLLIEISAKVARIDERTAFIQERLYAGDERMAQHEKRLTALERWRNRIVGAGVALAGILGWRLW